MSLRSETRMYTDGEQSERRIRHIEGLLEQQRRIAAELEQVDDTTRREVEEGLRHERAVSQMMAQSEPTTPPEYQDGFPSMYNLSHLHLNGRILILPCLRRHHSSESVFHKLSDITAWHHNPSKSLEHSADITIGWCHSSIYCQYHLEHTISVGTWITSPI